MNRALPEPGAALTLGIAFGIHEPLSDDVRTSLQDAGLIHVVVVSGLKIVLILGLVGAVARVFEWSRRRTLLVALPLIAAYVLISGAGPAAIRSALMAGAAMLAAAGARRTDPVPMLALVAALMLGISPQLVEDPGFQLSFLGTAGILLLATPIAVAHPGTPPARRTLRCHRRCAARDLSGHGRDVRGHLCRRSGRQCRSCCRSSL